MFDFYFAGYSDNDINNKIIELNGNILISYYRDKKTMDKLVDKQKGGWNGKLIVDSGAFTAHTKGVTIDIDEYCNWINNYSQNVFKFVNLDVIPGRWGEDRTHQQLIEGQEKSYENYKYILSNVICPEKILPVFHQGESLEFLDKYLNYEINGKPLDYICISARKDMSAQYRQTWYTMIYDHIKNSNNPNIKTHILGSALKKDATLFPVTSMDATTWIKQPIYGNIVGTLGTVYVGNKELMMAQPKQARDELLNRISRWNLTLEDICESSDKRILASIHGLYEMSQENLYIGYTSRKRRLF